MIDSREKLTTAPVAGSLTLANGATMRRMPWGGTYLFGYGSLVNRRSLARAVGREVAAEELRPARLAGWRRTWGAAERVIPDGQTEPVWAAFLDLEPDPTARVNGVLIALTDAELASVEARERGYTRVEVTDHVIVEPALQVALQGGTRTITFAGRKQPAPVGQVVLREYLRLVEEGFAALGPEQLAELRRTTEPAGAPFLDGPYRFADAGQNALTTWGADHA